MSKESRNRRRIELELYRRLDAEYVKLPIVKCQGKCHNECTTIGLTPVEELRLQHASGIHYPFIRRMKEVVYGSRNPEPCPHLSADKRCQSYAARPFVCRAYGAVQSLPCEHGCEVIGGILPDSDARQILSNVRAVLLPPEFDPEAMASMSTDMPTVDKKLVEMLRYVGPKVKPDPLT